MAIDYSQSSSGASSKKAIFLTNIPAPYRVAMLNRAQKMLKEKNVDLKVIFASAGYQRRSYWLGSIDKASFAYRFLNERSYQIGTEKLFTIGTSIYRILRNENPSIIISAGCGTMTLMASRYSSRYNIPLVIYYGETSIQAARRSVPSLRKLFRKYLFRRASGFLVYGRESKRLIESYGIRSDNIFIAINSIDTDEFCNKLERISINYNRVNEIHLLYVGNLQPLKGVAFVLLALQQIKAASKNEIHFDIVGDGPHRKHLEQMVKELKLTNVHFHGAMKNDDVIPFYQSSDFFIFPSLYDIFGLVMVEAACAGLPIIASKYAGGANDILQEGKNGFIVDPADLNQLSTCILELSTNSNLRFKMGEESKKIIAESVNIRKSGLGLTEAILSLCS